MDAAFRGRFEIRIDPKGRLSLPSPFRGPKSSQQFVITNGQFRKHRCLDVYTFNEWKTLEKRIRNLPPLNAHVQAFQRFYLSGGQLVELDSNSRLLIPLTLRKYAGLDLDVISVGMGDKFEIWSASNWNILAESLAQEFDDTLSGVAELETAARSKDKK